MLYSAINLFSNQTLFLNNRFERFFAFYTPVLWEVIDIRLQAIGITLLCYALLLWKLSFESSNEKDFEENEKNCPKVFYFRNSNDRNH